MTHESTLVLPVAVQLDKAVLIPSNESPALALQDLPRDSDQVRALDAVFTANEKESTTVTGLLGVWTGTMVLHDLAVETLSEPAGEVEADEEPHNTDEPEIL